MSPDDFSLGEAQRQIDQLWQVIREIRESTSLIPVISTQLQALTQSIEKISAFSETATAHDYRIKALEAEACILRDQLRDSEKDASIARARFEKSRAATCPYEGQLRVQKYILGVLTAGMTFVVSRFAWTLLQQVFGG